MALFAIEYKMVSNCLSILLDKLYYFMHIHCISLFCYRGINYYTKLQVDLVATPTTFYKYLIKFQNLKIYIYYMNIFFFFYLLSLLFLYNYLHLYLEK